MLVTEKGVILSVERFSELVEAETLLEATKRIVRANEFGMEKALSNLLDVYLEEKDG